MEWHDEQGHIDLLADDVVFVADSDGKAPAGRRPVLADRTASFVSIWRGERFADSTPWSIPTNCARRRRLQRRA